MGFVKTGFEVHLNENTEKSKSIWHAGTKISKFKIVL